MRVIVWETITGSWGHGQTATATPEKWIIYAQDPNVHYRVVTKEEFVKFLMSKGKSYPEARVTAAKVFS